jgi:hypothetical protein
MNKQFRIVRVRKITNIDKPIVVFDVEGKSKGIARTPKQVILDLQNSLRLPTNVTDINDPRVDNALRKCIGGTVSGDIKFFKAGDKYEVQEGHPALTDKSHEMFGKVKVGDELTASSDGAWVEGFLNLEYSQQNAMMTEVASGIAETFASIFGSSLAGMSGNQTPQLEVVDQDVDEELEEEVLGTTAKGKKKK